MVFQFTTWVLDFLIKNLNQSKKLYSNPLSKIFQFTTSYSDFIASSISFFLTDFLPEYSAFLTAFRAINKV